MVYKIRKTTTIPLVMLRKLEIIFKDHNWSLEFEGEQELFRRFCLMLSCLSKDQQECVLEVTKHFLRIDMNDYNYHIRRSLSKIDIALLDSTSRIYIVPINSEKGYEEYKSSNWMTYIFKDPTFIYSTVLKDKKLSVANTPDFLPKNFNTQPYIIMLVDDFIGSGETVISCLEYITKKNIDLRKAIILTLVIQNIGYERLKQKDIPILFSEYRERGINDKYQDPLKGKLINLMTSIEELLEVESNMRFGRNQTEALIKMMRTPNNTFPVYWEERKLKNGTFFYAPFPRQQKF